MITKGFKIKKNNSKFPNPLSQQELNKHIDPVLTQNLLKIQVDNLTYVQVTSVFWDIGGFSDLSNNLNDRPRHLNEFLQRYFALAVNIIQKHHGVLDKFIGDGIFAYFGYDGKDRTGNGDPVNAIRASLEFKTRFVNLKQYFVRFCKKNNGRDPSNISLKCGMDNGMAFIHYYNTPKRNSVIIFGSTVNFASRLSDFAEDDEIIISEGLKYMVDDKFICKKMKVEERKKRGIQSFENVENVYELVSRKDKASALKTKTSQTLESKFTRFSIPYKIRIGQPINIRAEFFGSVKFGFITMRIPDSAKDPAWLADTGTFDKNTQIGQLFLRNKKYPIQYVDTVLEDHKLQKGKGTATIFMYTDTNDSSKKRPIASKTKDIILI
jgi:class 3 adenylate cyclase